MTTLSSELSPVVIPLLAPMPPGAGFLGAPSAPTIRAIDDDGDDAADDAEEEGDGFEDDDLGIDDDGLAPAELEDFDEEDFDDDFDDDFEEEPDDFDDDGLAEDVPETADDDDDEDFDIEGVPPPGGAGEIPEDELDA